MRSLQLVHSVATLRPPATTDVACSNARSTTALDPEVRALLKHVRIIAPLPRLVRARALARARASIAEPRSARLTARLPPPARIYSIDNGTATGT
jgi:hypothetical protein